MSRLRRRGPRFVLPILIALGGATAAWHCIPPGRPGERAAPEPGEIGPPADVRPAFAGPDPVRELLDPAQRRAPAVECPPLAVQRARSRPVPTPSSREAG